MRKLIKKLMLSACSLCLLVACTEEPSPQQPESSNTSGDVRQQLDVYQNLAWHVVSLLQSQSTPTQISDSVTTLIGSSKQLFVNLKEQLPECEESLNVMAQIAMIKQQHIEIENGGSQEELPKLPEFSAPSCYHAQKLLLNPLAVYTLTQQADLAQSDYQHAKLKMIDSFARIKQIEMIAAE
jgi:hypothetical protein